MRVPVGGDTSEREVPDALPFTDSFGHFKESLGDALHQAHAMGASRGTILNAAKDVAEWLNAEVDPQSPEQRVLKELWDVADDNERHSLTNMLVKFVDHDSPRRSMR